MLKQEKKTKFYIRWSANS